MPMLAGGLAMTVAGLWIIQNSMTHLFEAQLASRGHVLVTALSHALMKPHSQADLRVLIDHVLKDEPSIRAVALVLRDKEGGGDVMASAARFGDERLETHIREEIKKAKLTKSTVGHWEDNGDFEISRPVHWPSHMSGPRSNPGNSNGTSENIRGMIMVRLDPTSVLQAVEILRNELIAGFLILLFSAMGLVYLLLQRQVLHPLSYMVEMLHRQADGDQQLRLPEFASDEMNHVASAINSGFNSGQRRLDDFASTSAYWFWEMDAELRFTYFSENANSILGTKAGSLLGMQRKALLDDDTSRQAWAEHLALLKARKPFRDFIYQRAADKNGPLWTRVSGAPIFDAQGQFAGYRGIAADVAEVKRYEQELQRQENRWTNVLKGTSAGLWVMENGRIFASPNIETWLGLPAGTLADFGYDYWQSRIHPDDRAATQEELARHLRGETEVFQQEYRVCRSDGSYLWVECRGQGLKGADGRIDRMAGSFIDIQERKSTELALREAIDQAQSANRSKSAFLANMSHELRTPLNAIIGFSEALEQRMLGETGGEANAEYVAHIRQSGTHLLNIVNDILDITKIETGHFDLHLSEFSISDNIKICQELMGAQELGGGRVFRIDVAVDAPTLVADERAFRQILLNVLSNAVKFSPDDRPIEIFLSGDAGDGLTLSVRDHGIGMDPDEAALAMQPYAQVDNALSRRYQGTGLGLPISNALMELHGGSLTIESAPGVGTTVKLFFPPNCVRDYSGDAAQTTDANRDRYIS